MGSAMFRSRSPLWHNPVDLRRDEHRALPETPCGGRHAPFAADPGPRGGFEVSRSETQEISQWQI